MSALDDIYESIIHVKDARRKLGDAAHDAGSLANIVGGVCFIHGSMLLLTNEEETRLHKAACHLSRAAEEINAFLETAWEEGRP
ncbi:MAG: hypothetical protein LUC33_03075 [Prevotellaceae bacterium]|nr:hypothetical protein [Prevotellaceae bacterium]